MANKDIAEFLVREEERTLYSELLKTPPKFTDENDSVIYNANNFFYLSGFTGLPSQKGPDEDWFLQTLKTTTNADQLIEGLKGASERRQKQLLELSQKALAGSTEVSEKQNVTTNMADIIAQIESWSSGFDGLVAKLIEANFIHGLQPPVRARLARRVFQFAFERDVNVGNFFTTAPWNQPVYAPIKWEAVNQTKVLATTAVTNLASVNDGEFATNETDAIAHLKVLAEKSNQEEQEVQNQLKPLFDKLVISIFAKPAEQRLQLIQVAVKVDKKKLSKDVFIQKQVEIMQGANYQSEIQFVLSNQQNFLSYIGANELKNLRKVGIDFLKNRTTVDWSPLGDVFLTHEPWEESERILILDALFHHLADKDVGMFNYTLEYLKKPELRNFVKPEILLNKLFQILAEVEEDKREVILEHLDKTNWAEIGQLIEASQNILTSYVKGKSSIAKKARKVMKSWEIKLPRAKTRAKTRAKKGKKTRKSNRKRK